MSGPGLRKTPRKRQACREFDATGVGWVLLAQKFQHSGSINPKPSPAQERALGFKYKDKMLYLINVTYGVY
jgi:hypothetical protein